MSQAPPPYNPNFGPPPPPPPQAGWSVPLQQQGGPGGYPPPPPPNAGYGQQNAGYGGPNDGSGYGGPNGGGGGPGGAGGANFVPPPPPHTYAGGAYGSAGGAGSADPEWGGIPKDSGLGFNNRTIRQGFIRKVFTILSAQLVFVAALVALFVFEQNVNKFVRTNAWLIHLSYLSFIIVYFVIVCCENVRRRFPGNMICLFVLTASLGSMTAIIASMYEVREVFIALAVTVVTCGSIIIFAMQTKYDFTGCIAVMFVASIVLLLFGIIILLFATAFSGHFKILWLVYCGLATMLFMVYLAIDVQLVIGGKRFQLSPEDYVLAATQLFVDIVYIFLYLLQIIGLSSK